MNERQTAQARPAVDWARPLGAEQTALDALALVVTGRPEMALRLLTNLPWIPLTWAQRENTAGSVRYDLSRLVRACLG